MSGDVFPEKRKSKKDKVKKRRQGVYKRGGQFRATNVKESGVNKEPEKTGKKKGKKKSRKRK